MDRPLITLTTDFGADSHYVAQMKAVLLTDAPQVDIVDVTHSVRPQNIPNGAFLLAESAFWFPRGTIHIAVVDPGVGSDRAMMGVSAGGHIFLLPDNGLVTSITDRHPPEVVVRLSNREYWRQETSNTFHGRDILSPVAAAIANGTPLTEFGPTMSEVRTLSTDENQSGLDQLNSDVVHVDSFGNLILRQTDPDWLDAHQSHTIEIQVGQQRFQCRIVRCYAEAAIGDPVTLVNSSGNWEIAVVNGNAADILGISLGDRIEYRLIAE